MELVCYGQIFAGRVYDGRVYDEDESLRYTSKWEFVLVVIKVELLLVGIKLGLGS